MYVQEGLCQRELRSRGITTKGGKSKGDNISSQHNSETAGRYANFLVEGGGGVDRRGELGKLLPSKTLFIASW